MTNGEQRQRLAAILAADASGFSRLMERDEHATLEALEAARAVFRQEVESNQGRVIDTAGASLTFKIGDTGSWMNLSGASPQMPNVKPGTMDHLGIGIDLPKAPEPLRQALKMAFPASNVRSPGQPGDLTYDLEAS